LGVRQKSSTAFAINDVAKQNFQLISQKIREAENIQFPENCRVAGEEGLFKNCSKIVLGEKVSYLIYKNGRVQPASIFTFEIIQKTGSKIVLTKGNQQKQIDLTPKNIQITKASFSGKMPTSSNQGWVEVEIEYVPKLFYTISKGEQLKFKTIIVPNKINF